MPNEMAQLARLLVYATLSKHKYSSLINNLILKNFISIFEALYKGLAKTSTRKKQSQVATATKQKTLINFYCFTN